MNKTQIQSYAELCANRKSQLKKNVLNFIIK